MEERTKVFKGFFLLFTLVMIVSIGCGDPDSGTGPSQDGSAYYVSQTGDDANPGTQDSPWGVGICVENSDATI